MALVHKQPVHTKLLKGYDIILPCGIVQLIQLCNQGFTALFHLFNGIALAPLCLCQCYCRFDLINLSFNDRDLSFRGKRDLFKLTVTDDHRIIITRCDTGTEFLTVRRFKVLLRCCQDIRSGIQS